jgi:hypothetical protein
VFLNALLFCLLSVLSFNADAQGLDGIIVEEFHTITQADADAYNNDFGGGGFPLVAGMKTYRVFVDMAPNYELIQVYGAPIPTGGTVSPNPLDFTTTTTFWNDDNFGTELPAQTRRFDEGTLFDSYITAGTSGISGGTAGCGSNLAQVGVPRTSDTNGDLTTCGVYPGFTGNDGHLPGTGGALTYNLGGTMNFAALQANGNNFTVVNESWGVLGGNQGVDPTGTNRILVAQFTTNGVFSFHINVQLSSPSSVLETYVWNNAAPGETLRPELTYPLAAVPDCNGVPGGAALPGTSCNDNNACTINDIWSPTCVCAGTVQDTDGDGTCDANDGCPTDPNKTVPGACGCGVADVATTYYADVDGDGFGAGAPIAGFTCTVPPGTVTNNTDGCPSDPNKQAPGVCGCGVADVATTYYADVDGDGFGDPANSQAGFTCSVPAGSVTNNTDGCPTDALKQAPGVCGCGVADTDTDNDGLADCVDPCPAGPNPGTSCNDNNACTINDVIGANCQCAGTFQDSDSDGICDANDNCPNLSGQQGDACNDSNPTTTNDIINASCVCAGTPPSQFTVGNVVVLQAGTGTGSLANTGNPIVLREFTSTGNPGFSVTVPSTGATPIVISGSATSEGNLSLSADGSKLVFAGYAQALPNATALAGSSSGTINRAIGTVDNTGTFARESVSATFFSGNNPRGAAASGTNFWGAGANQGVNYFGTGTPATIASGKTNLRGAAVFNGQLYVSSASTAGTPAVAGIFAVGSGLPTTSPQTLTTVVGTGNANTNGFYLSPAGTTLYVTIGAGGIQKWTNSGTWALAYTLTFADGANSVVADFSGSNPIVYAVSNAGNKLLKFTDPNSGSGSVAVTPSTIATAAANTAFRGISFAPQACTPTNWYADTDGDGFGAGAATLACTQPVGSVANNTDDCPTDALKQSPGVCGCGVADVAATYYADVDGDGFGDPAASQAGFTCNVPAGFVTNNTDDCPTDALKQAPGACGCGVADVPATYYADTDGDGFGAGAPIAGFTCIVPPGTVTNNTDNCPAVVGVIGSACDDGNVNTTGDVLDANCVCAGQLIDCLGVAGGTALPGTACNDNNAATGNDVYGANCVCAGQLIDCLGVAGGTALPGTACNDNNAATGNDVYGANCVCAGQLIDCLGVAGGSALPGTACNDNNAATGNDVYGANCVCAGQLIDCLGLAGGTALPGTSCDDSNAGTTNDVYGANCVCAGTPIGGGCTLNEVTLTLSTDNNGAQTSWEIVPSAGGVAVCSGSNYASNTTIASSCCLPNGCYNLRVFDSFGDGMASGTTGGWVLRNAANARIIDNAGDGIWTGPVAQALDAFCLPIGADLLTAATCDQESVTTSFTLQVVENTAVTAQYNLNNNTSGYQFWIYNPDGTYSRRVFQSHQSPGNGFPSGTPAALRASYFRLNTLTTNPVPGFTLLNVRVRGRVAGTYAEFGPACRMKVDPTVNCQTTQLTTTATPVISCGATVPYPGGAIHANEVIGANRYQFRFTRPGYTRNVSSTSRTLTLSPWSTNPLQPGLCYDVVVRGSFDGGLSWCAFGASCQVCTSLPAPVADTRELTTTDAATFTIWPNPNNGEQLSLSIDDLGAEHTTVSLDIVDLFGKQLVKRTIAVNGTTLNTVIELNGDLASGMYLVSVTVGERTFMQRLVIR